jgi:hypothetical protein
MSIEPDKTPLVRQNFESLQEEGEQEEGEQEEGEQGG